MFHPSSFNKCIGGDHDNDNKEEVRTPVDPSNPPSWDGMNPYLIDDDNDNNDDECNGNAHFNPNQGSIWSIQPISNNDDNNKYALDEYALDSATKASTVSEIVLEKNTIDMDLDMNLDILSSPATQATCLSSPPDSSLSSSPLCASSSFAISSVLCAFQKPNHRKEEEEEELPTTRILFPNNKRTSRLSSS